MEANLRAPEMPSGKEDSPAVLLKGQCSFPAAALALHGCSAQGRVLGLDPGVHLEPWRQQLQGQVSQSWAGLPAAPGAQPTAPTATAPRCQLALEGSSVPGRQVLGSWPEGLGALPGKQKGSFMPCLQLLPAEPRRRPLLCEGWRPTVKAKHPGRGGPGSEDGSTRAL